MILVNKKNLYVINYNSLLIQQKITDNNKNVFYLFILTN